MEEIVESFEFYDGRGIMPRKWNRKKFNRIELYIKRASNKKDKDNYWKRLLKSKK